MGLELRNIQRHATRVDETTGQKYTTLVHSNPYVRLNSGNGPPIFVQGGRAYSEGGNEYDFDKFPSWFMELAANVGSVVAKECGLDRLIEEIEGAKPSAELASTREYNKTRKELPKKNKTGQFVTTKKSKAVLKAKAAKKKRIHKTAAEEVIAEAEAKAEAEKE